MASSDHDRRTDFDASRDAASLEKAIYEVKRVIVGQDRLVERVMVGLLAKGHILLEGVPGVAKTLAVETFAKVVGGSFSRVQFTPDLVPTDLIGTRIYRQGKEEFDIELGPVVTNFLLADEINRAPAKVQSALLEVMAERQVSIGGRTFPMPDPFLVMATQNPIENEGVYPLPEAQRDRFLFKIIVDYPTIEEEREIVYRMGVEPPTASQVLDSGELIRLQDAASSIFVHHALVDYVVRVIVATRAPEQLGMHDVAAWVAYGASPRATLGIISAARALALVRGRDYVIPQDVIEVIPDVLRHRLVLSYDALADEITAESVIARILQTVGLPQVAPQPVAGPAPSQFPGAQTGYPNQGGPVPGGPQQSGPQQNGPQQNGPQQPGPQQHGPQSQGAPNQPPFPNQGGQNAQPFTNPASQGSAGYPGAPGGQFPPQPAQQQPIQQPQSAPQYPQHPGPQAPAAPHGPASSANPPASATAGASQQGSPTPAAGQQQSGTSGQPQRGDEPGALQKPSGPEPIQQRQGDPQAVPNTSARPGTGETPAQEPTDTDSRGPDTDSRDSDNPAQRQTPGNGGSATPSGTRAPTGPAGWTSPAPNR